MVALSPHTLAEPLWIRGRQGEFSADWHRQHFIFSVSRALWGAGEPPLRRAQLDWRPSTWHKGSQPRARPQPLLSRQGGVFRGVFQAPTDRTCGLWPGLSAKVWLTVAKRPFPKGGFLDLPAVCFQWVRGKHRAVWAPRRQPSAHWRDSLPRRGA